MGRIDDLIEVYNPLAKSQEQTAVVEAPAEPDPAECSAVSTVNGAAAGMTVISFEKLPLRSWKDSPQVTALSSFLKGPAGHGIQLVVEKNSFSLKFNTGLRPDRDPERWQSAEKAYGLLLDALEDLIELKDLGLISPARP
ncbi:hypothetical protein SAMN04489760_110110 [Syntrophus gentianae]|uniref:Uncharacterized protein n=1 Tax=Syntrophus gentianae TaxID=43775 RepID=A0A1H7XGF0_9BACT|nr:hypothetical protein [Syntrophus gentianae]SEM32876.1 hypothetical protein SAMN04489760_110110 [Syntrophus gentianae]